MSDILILTTTTTTTKTGEQYLLFCFQVDKGKSHTICPYLNWPILPHPNLNSALTFCPVPMIPVAWLLSLRSVPLMHQLLSVVITLALQRVFVSGRSTLISFFFFFQKVLGDAYLFTLSDELKNQPVKFL